MIKLRLILGSLFIVTAIFSKEIVQEPIIVTEPTVQEVKEKTTIDSKEIEESRNRFGVGAAYSMSDKLYKQEDNDKSFVPDVIINYGIFYINGFQVGLTPYENDLFSLSLFINPKSGFSVDSSDMKKGYENIDDRDTSLAFGADLDFNELPYGISSTLSYSQSEEGGQGDLVIGRDYYVSEKLLVTPALLASVYSKDMLNYYFGVSEVEVNKSSTDELDAAYSLELSYSYGAQLSMNYFLTEHFTLLANIGINKFSDDIKNSPIVENDIVFSSSIGLRYTF